jgi:hypothetical protein
VKKEMPPEIRESEVAAQWDRNADVWTDQVRNRWDIFRELSAKMIEVVTLE